MNKSQKTRLLNKIKNHFKNANNCVSCINSRFNMNEYDLDNIEFDDDEEYVLIHRKQTEVFIEQESKFLYDVINKEFAKIID